MAHGYTAEEKQCLKEGWGDEYHFLSAYQLSIYKEEDREEGRCIVQGLMEHEKRKTEASKTQSAGQAVGSTKSGASTNANSQQQHKNNV